ARGLRSFFVSRMSAVVVMTRTACYGLRPHTQWAIYSRRHIIQCASYTARVQRASYTGRGLIYSSPPDRVRAHTQWAIYSRRHIYSAPHIQGGLIQYAGGLIHSAASYTGG